MSYRKTGIAVGLAGALALSTVELCGILGDEAIRRRGLPALQ